MMTLTRTLSFLILANPKFLQFACALPELGYPLKRHRVAVAGNIRNSLKGLPETSGSGSGLFFESAEVFRMSIDLLPDVNGGTSGLFRNTSGSRPESLAGLDAVLLYKDRVTAAKLNFYFRRTRSRNEMGDKFQHYKPPSNDLAASGS